MDEGVPAASGETLFRVADLAADEGVLRSGDAADEGVLLSGEADVFRSKPEGSGEALSRAADLEHRPCSVQPKVRVRLID